MDYLILSWTWGQPSKTAERFCQTLDDEGQWACAVRQSRLCVYVRADRPLQVRTLPGERGVIIGEIFDRSVTEAGAVATPDLSKIPGGLCEEGAAWLVTQCWGRYVAVLTSPNDPPLVLRAPLGDLDAISWSRDDVWLVTARLHATGGPGAPPALPSALAPKPSIDWSRLCQLLGDPSLAPRLLPLNGVEALSPGSARWLAQLEGSEPDHEIVLWRPEPHCITRPAGERPSRQALERRLVQLTDACVAALAHDQSPVLCEISGGLDSAIVAASLVANQTPDLHALNVFWQRPEGDERAYAQAAADRLGLDLTTQAETPEAISQQDLLDLGRGVRLSFNGVDRLYDQILADQAQAGGVRSLFTGQGGDAIFYQMAHPALAVDILLGPGGQSLKARLAFLGDLSRRARRSVWRLLWDGLVSAPGLGRGVGIWGHSQPMARLLTPKALSLARARPGKSKRLRKPARPLRIPRAKQVQIQALTNNLSVFGDSRRGAVTRLSHPLLAQPIVELCLSIPAAELASGVFDRALARRAFVGRVPEAILQRRGKGDVSSYFAKTVALSQAALQDFLLQGRLVARGMVDPDAVSDILSPDTLILQDASAEIISLAVIEAWVRCWTPGEARQSVSDEPASRPAAPGDPKPGHPAQGHPPQDHPASRLGAR